MQKKILITGGSGFFGKSVLDTLIKSPDDFQAICIFNRNKIELSDPRITSKKCDLFDRRQIKTIISEYKPTHCIHLAWDVPPEAFWTSEKNIEWIKASYDLFVTFAEHGGEVFIGAGSIAEYGNSEFLSENTEQTYYPDTLYGQCKKSLRELLHISRDNQFKNLNIIWPHIGYFFGTHEPEKKFFKRLVRSLLLKEEVPLTTASFSRPYADVKHFGNIIVKLLNIDHPNDITFNLSASVNRSIQEIANFACDKLASNTNLLGYDKYLMPTSLPLKLSIENNYVKNIYGDSIDMDYWDDFKNYIDRLR